jgi:hypothetical protein
MLRTSENWERSFFCNLIAIETIQKTIQKLSHAATKVRSHWVHTLFTLLSLKQGSQWCSRMFQGSPEKGVYLQWRVPASKTIEKKNIPNIPYMVMVHLYCLLVW